MVPQVRQRQPHKLSATTGRHHHARNDERLRDIALVEVEIKEISNALEAFKSEVTSGASVGELSYGRLIKE